MGWEKIKGQNKVVSLLRHAVARNRLPHAYLFLGPEGVGKKLTALTLAQVINCAEQGRDYCGHCVSCHKVGKGIHPDVVLIEPQDTGKIKIEEVRHLQETIAYKPFEGRYKIWVIDQADKMTLQAANCLLKTLEEPPDNSLIILVASQASALLPTVVSRCQQVKFARLTTSVLRELLVGQGISPEVLELGVALANGSASQISQEQLDDYWAWRDVVINYLQGEESNFAAAFALGEKLAKEKDQIEKLIQLLNLWYRDLLLHKLGLDKYLLINKDKFEELSRQVSRLELPIIQKHLKLIQQSFSALQYNANPRMVLENTLLQLN